MSTPVTLTHATKDSTNSFYALLRYPTKTPGGLGELTHLAKFYSSSITDAQEYMSQKPQLRVLKPSIKSNDLVSSAKLLPQDWYVPFIYDAQANTLHSLFMRKSFFINQVNITENKNRTHINFWYCDSEQNQRKFSFVLGNDLVENCRDFLLKDVVSCYLMKEEKRGILSYSIPIVRTR